MTCHHCGAELPPFALFCGECGRSVSAPAVVPPVVERPMAPATSPLPVVAPSAEALLPSPAAPVETPPVTPPTEASAPRPMPIPTLLPVGADALPWSADAPLSIDSPATPTEAPPSSLAPCETCGTQPEPDDLFCAECGRPLPGDTRAIAPLPSVVPEPAAPEPALPEPAAAVVRPSDPAPDVESTRIVPRGTGGARFVLQFSTGESYTVLGSGLAGRNPRPEPGEYVDHLVTIVDPGRSVSKTHFEFGQDAGVFWISDRHSGNGSVLREPGAEPRACEPGRRYPIVRGTRIDIGEQFVVVS